MASDGWERFKDKKVKVVFDDGRQIAIKEGILLNAAKEYILIKCKDTDEAISTSRIIRIELLK